MAGIYLHIPYCHQACHYCDFHFSTNLATRADLVTCLVEELKLKKELFTNETVETIYFGGGTPSVLSTNELGKLVNAVHQHYRVQSSHEQTLEANPEDVTPESIANFEMLGFNRVSIGTQTFNDKVLKFLNRNHNSAEATSAIDLLKSSSISNITCDLIFGIPEPSYSLKSDLERLVAFDLPHVSIYGLTIEERTAFGHQARTGLLHEISEDKFSEQYLEIHKVLSENAYQHYEVSNFCKPGFQALHNTAYWQQKMYLGIGPGAHSYLGNKRMHNVRNNSKYIKEIKSGTIPETVEELTTTQRLNEYIITHIRTQVGIDCTDLTARFSVDLKADKKGELEQMIRLGLVTEADTEIRPTVKGFLMADELALKLSYDD